MTVILSNLGMCPTISLIINILADTLWFSVTFPKSLKYHIDMVVLCDNYLLLCDTLNCCLLYCIEFC